MTRSGSEAEATDYLRDMVDHWRAAFDWREQESRINEFPQFLTEIDGQTVLDLRQQPVPLLSLRRWLGLPETTLEESAAVVLQSGEQRFCLAVDSVRGREEVVIKALPKTLRGLPGYAGASLIGDGRMALILDVDALYRTGVRGGR